MGLWLKLKLDVGYLGLIFFDFWVNCKVTESNFSKNLFKQCHTCTCTRFSQWVWLTSTESPAGAKTHHTWNTPSSQDMARTWWTKRRPRRTRKGGQTTRGRSDGRLWGWSKFGDKNWTRPQTFYLCNSITICCVLIWKTIKIITLKKK